MAAPPAICELSLSFSPVALEKGTHPRPARTALRRAGTPFVTAPAPPANGLRLFTSNRLETLADKLALAMRRPPRSPLQPEVIVVRNKGMERWLKLELAARNGICAHCEFHFPEQFVARVFHAALPDTKNLPLLSRDVMAWRLHRALAGVRDRPGFEPVAHYLGADNDERKRLQLAGKLANLFDQYLIFRPEMMLDWDAARLAQGDAAWQAELWRAISDDARERHPAALARTLADVLAEDSSTLADIPERISVFGVSALPPFHVELLAALAGRIEVNLFLLQPSQEYWGDITSPREEERIRRRALKADEAAFDLHLESGNRLLASLGYLGRDFLKLLLGAGDWMPDEDFASPGEDTLLHCIQSDLLHLRDRGAIVSAAEGRTPIASGDDSLQIHSCHSPLREMEVLHDHILHWFQRDPAIAPRDIVVMMPDIETHAPYVEAVFGAPDDDRHRIPYSFADRGARRESHVIGTFLQLLALPETRLGAATVLAPLETAAVRQRFDLSERDVETVRDWVRDANIRWGMDATHRASLGLPALDANTWRAGLDRLLLGYAMRPDGARLFNGILPFDAIEGEAASLAGGLAEFVEKIFALVGELQTPRPLDAWAALLERALADFFAPDDEAEREFQLLRSSFHELREQQRLSGFTGAISLAALRERLEPALADDLQHAGFITGGVTFCGLKPMRSIPFKIVCVVGLNDGAFPRPTQRLGFDLMARAPRLGDRSTREDDRYLFLETLLSARQRLYLSYVGQSVRDNREASPSVLVSELLDYVEQGFECEGSNEAQEATTATSREQNSVRQRLVTRHRLQAFHPDYFNRRQPRLFSYSMENCRASVASGAADGLRASFLEQPLGEPEAGFRAVSLESLAQFFANPAKFFLKNRLNIVLRETPDELEEREPFILGGLDDYSIKQDLVARALAGEPATGARAVARASGLLPLGAVGQADFARAEGRVESFLARLRPLRRAGAPLEISFSPGDFTVTGRINDFTNEGPLFHRCAKRKARGLLGAWLHHLAVNCLRPGQTTTLLSEDGRSRFAPVADPAAVLRALLDLYWEGLHAPLKFFPNSALALAEAEHAAARAKSRAKRAPAIDKARACWEGSRFPAIDGEKDAPAFDLCFRHLTDPLDADFERNARAIFAPLLEHETHTEA